MSTQSGPCEFMHSGDIAFMGSAYVLSHCTIQEFKSGGRTSFGAILFLHIVT